MVRKDRHTDVQNPPKTNRSDEASVAEALYIQAKGDTSPCANEILGCIPEEYGDTTPYDTCYA
jgi:hypothetical protein